MPDGPGTYVSKKGRPPESKTMGKNGGNGLTKQQKALPPALQKKILAAKKGKKNEDKEKRA